MITQSDGVKLGLLAGEPVASPRLLAPTRSDIRYLRRFLDETADACNRRVCERLAVLLTAIHDKSPGLFVPQAMADRLAASFRGTAQVAGAAGAIPPD